MQKGRIYCCDNLVLLKYLPSDYIDLIYCDILYGTGNKYKEYQDLKCNRKIIEDFYTARIKQMYRVLKKTGSIYLHMDWRISHWIRYLMDDIFGMANFQNEIIWCYKTGGATKKRFGKKHDTIYFYTKTSQHIFNPQKEKSYMLHEYGFKKSNFQKDDKGQYSWVITKDWWEIPAIGSATKERLGYPTQKPEALLEKIILASSNRGDLVADFFCGSGTVGVVCQKLGRKYLLCDNSKEAIRITKKRLRQKNAEKIRDI